MTLPLWPFQELGRANLREAFKQAREVLYVAPTGSGKTVTAVDIIHRLMAKGNRALFLAHRKELIDQCSRKLDAYGLGHGVIKSGHWRCRPHLPIQVASVPTLINRPMMPEAELVILDEAHHCVAGSFAEVLSRYPRARLLGLTATPYRLDGRGLGEWYHRIVVAAQIADLVDGGYLARPRVFRGATPPPDLRGVKKTGGDYNSGALARAMGGSAVIGDMVSTYQQHGEGRPFLGFGVTIELSKRYTERMCAAGIPTEHVDGTMREEDRQAVLDRFQSGVTRGMFNVGIFSEGYDAPWASCLIDMAPTASRQRHRQKVGRVMRGGRLVNLAKLDAIILDHAGNSYRHAIPDHGCSPDSCHHVPSITEPEEFSLDGVQARQAQPAVVSFRTCPKCYAVFASGPACCPECGYELPKKKRVVIERAGELREFQQAGRQRIPEDRRAAMLAGWIRKARAAGHLQSAPYMVYRGFFGERPSDEVIEAAEMMVGAAEVANAG